MSDLLQQIRAEAEPLWDASAKGERLFVRLADLEGILGGMVLVPREPTPDMIERGYKALMEWDARTGEDMGISEVWRTMVDAPTATPGEGE